MARDEALFFRVAVLRRATASTIEGDVALKKYHGMWASSFLAQAERRKNEKCQAPLTQEHGSASLKPVWRRVIG